MERGPIIFVAVIVAVLSLFGLKVWSDRTAASTLEAESRGATERLARAGGLHGAPDSWNQGESGSDGGYSRPGGSLRVGLPSGNGAVGAAGHGPGSGPDGRGGGPAGSLRAGGSTAGGALGASGSGRSPGGWGNALGDGPNVVGGEGGNHAVPKAAQKQNLVDFLSSQPPTQAKLGDTKNADGSDVALKIDNLGDISKQGGQQQNVQAADDGQGIKVADGSDISFPNNVNPDAATISLKVQPDWSGSDQSDNALLELRGQNDWSNRIELVKNGDFLRFIVTPDSGQESDISVRITNWQAGDEHDIQATYGDGKTSLYIDGQLAGSNQYTGQLQPPSNAPVRIGSDWPGSNYQPFMGTIRNVSITGPNG